MVNEGQDLSGGYERKDYTKEAQALVNANGGDVLKACEAYLRTAGDVYNGIMVKFLMRATRDVLKQVVSKTHKNAHLDELVIMMRETDLIRKRKAGDSKALEMDYVDHAVNDIGRTPCPDGLALSPDKQAFLGEPVRLKTFCKDGAPVAIMPLPPTVNDLLVHNMAAALARRKRGIESPDPTALHLENVRTSGQKSLDSMNLFGGKETE